MELSPRPGLGEIFLTWLVIGIQSFGGGSSTFLLIHETCIKKGWVGEDEFIRDWALAQIAPGINLVKLTAMLGHRLRGWPGLVAAMAGLLLPSGAVTVLMTAGFGLIRSQPLVVAAMKGVLPATIGLTLAMGVQMAQPLFNRAFQEGRVRLGAHVLIMVLAALLMLVVPSISPVAVLLGSGLAGIAVFALLPSPASAVRQEGEDAG
ncbi:MAG TPA: chromate transporter [Anaerolineaceae bacterium]|nr:chromate transporter [Anaerolineaceae bacterium]